MSKIKGIHHVALKVSTVKFDEVMKFYTEILDLTVVRTWNEGKAAMVSTGDNSVLEIMASEDWPLDCAEGPFAHVALETDAVDELTEKIRAAGYQITVEPTDVTIPSEEPYPIRISFCIGAGNEIVEFFHVK